MPANRTLSGDVYLVAGLVGQVLQAIAGRPDFDLEEAARAGDAQAGDRLAAHVVGVSVEEAQILTRAFTSYFQLINLAEDNE